MISSGQQIQLAARAIRERSALAKACRDLDSANYELANSLLELQGTPVWGTALDALKLTEAQAQSIIDRRLLPSKHPVVIL